MFSLKCCLLLLYILKLYREGNSSVNSFIFQSEWLKTNSQVIGNTSVFFWSDLYCLSFVCSVLSELKNQYSHWSLKSQVSWKYSDVSVCIPLQLQSVFRACHINSCNNYILQYILNKKKVPVIPFSFFSCCRQLLNGLKGKDWPPTQRKSDGVFFSSKYKWRAEFT